MTNSATSISESTKEIVQKCAFCGGAANTIDHVPPKGLFLKPRPALITVPACWSCNNGFSKLDERFRNVVALRAGVGLSRAGHSGSPQARALLNEKVLRSFQRNPREALTMLRTAHAVPMLTYGGIYIGHVFAMNIDGHAHDRGVERIVRGLSFHHYGETFPRNVPVRNMILDVDRPGLNDLLGSIVPKLNVRSVGGNIFEYAYGRLPDKPEISLWFLSFYKRHLVCAYTGTAVLDAADGAF